MTVQPIPSEDTLEPDLPILDAHHHLWDNPTSRFLLEEYLAQSGGHNIVGSVYIQCRVMYRSSGPEELRVIGETEFANGIAAMSESGRYGPSRICAGIVTHANLLLGDRVGPVLDAHIRVAGGRYRGVRHLVAWDADETLLVPGYKVVPGMMSDATFRKGLECLMQRDLGFEAFLFHPQIPELIDLARAMPGLKIILNHVGTPVRKGVYAGKDDAVFANWAGAAADLAGCPNVYVKLGGLGLHWTGFPFAAGDGTSSATIAAAWRPYIMHCIEEFGVDRCMFESNFPPDGHATSLHTLWNAHKRIAAGMSADEKDRLFRKTAIDAYRLDLPV